MKLDRRRLEEEQKQYNHWHERFRECLMGDEQLFKQLEKIFDEDKSLSFSTKSKICFLLYNTYLDGIMRSQRFADLMTEIKQKQQ